MSKDGQVYGALKVPRTPRMQVGPRKPESVGHSVLRLTGAARPGGAGEGPLHVPPAHPFPLLSSSTWTPQVAKEVGEDTAAGHSNCWKRR